ncbi:MAG TPA: serine hydrolase [Blastocatellia bacterium]|nr:serine hydrolase [Blastocatellia bacterium]
MRVPTITHSTWRLHALELRHFGYSRFAAAFVAVFALFLTCWHAEARQEDRSNYYPTSQWRTSSPSEQGLDAKILKKLVKRIRKNKIAAIDSLLVVRNGYLVVDEYFNGSRPDYLHTLQSDTKSVTSLLIGIAAQQGLISSLDQEVLGFFPEYRRIRNVDDLKSAMTLRDLLTMRTGLDWGEDPYQGSPLFQLNNCQCDWLKFVLDWPMRETPGTRFEYNSGGVILLGGVIRNVSGMPTDVFAQQKLFDPLGITQVRWYYGEPDNLPHMGGGLNMKARDMAKLGYLVLKKGLWEDRQIVSREWLDESMQHHVRNPRTFGSHPVDYGYLWWLLPLDGAGRDQGEQADVYTAAGARDQWIFVIPRYDMVVVVTGDTVSTFAQPVDFLYTDILSAVR